MSMYFHLRLKQAENPDNGEAIIPFFSQDKFINEVTDNQNMFFVFSSLFKPVTKEEKNISRTQLQV